MAETVSPKPPPSRRLAATGATMLQKLTPNNSLKRLTPGFSHPMRRLSETSPKEEMAAGNGFAAASSTTIAGSVQASPSPAQVEIPVDPSASSLIAAPVLLSSPVSFKQPSIRPHQPRVPLRLSMDAAFQTMKSMKIVGNKAFPSSPKFEAFYNSNVIQHFVNSVLLYMMEFTAAAAAAERRSKEKIALSASSPATISSLPVSPVSVGASAPRGSFAEASRLTPVVFPNRSIDGAEAEGGNSSIPVDADGSPSDPRDGATPSLDSRSSDSSVLRPDGGGVAGTTAGRSSPDVGNGRDSPAPVGAGDRSSLSLAPVDNLWPGKSAALLRVARDYSRVLLECSHFESTSSDVAFFECLYFFVATAVKFALPKPELWPIVEREVGRLFRSDHFGAASTAASSSFNRRRGDPSAVIPDVSEGGVDEEEEENDDDYGREPALHEQLYAKTSADIAIGNISRANRRLLKRINFLPEPPPPAPESVGTANQLRVCEEPNEMYALITKNLGNGLFYAMCANDGFTRVLSVKARGGRGKVQHWWSKNAAVRNGSWVLVAVKDLEGRNAQNLSNPYSRFTEKKMQRCDLVEVYSDTEKEKLKASVHDVDWEFFFDYDNARRGGGGGNIRQFANNDNAADDASAIPPSSAASASSATGGESTVTAGSARGGGAAGRGGDGVKHSGSAWRAQQRDKYSDPEVGVDFHEDAFAALASRAEANLTNARKLRAYIESPRRNIVANNPKAKRSNVGKKFSLSLSPAVMLVVEQSAKERRTGGAGEDGGAGEGATTTESKAKSKSKSNAFIPKGFGGVREGLLS